MRKIIRLDEKIEKLLEHIDLCKKYRKAQEEIDHSIWEPLEIELFKILQDAGFYSRHTHHTNVSIASIILEMKKRKLI